MHLSFNCTYSSICNPNCAKMRPKRFSWHGWGWVVLFIRWPASRAIRGTQGLWVHRRHMALKLFYFLLLFIILLLEKPSSSAQGPPMPWGCSVRSRNGYRYIRTFNSCLWCQGFTHASDPGEEPHQFLCGKAVEMGSNQQKQCIIWPDFEFKHHRSQITEHQTNQRYG